MAAFFARVIILRPATWPCSATGSIICSFAGVALRAAQHTENPTSTTHTGTACLDPAHIFNVLQPHSPQITDTVAARTSRFLLLRMRCSMYACIRRALLGLLGLLGDAGALNWSWMVHCMRRVCGRHVVVNRHFGALGPSSHKFTHSLTHSVRRHSLQLIFQHHT